MLYKSIYMPKTNIFPMGWKTWFHVEYSFITFLKDYIKRLLLNYEEKFFIFWSKIQVLLLILK